MTTTRDDLLALAERCEKASEGSRELDARIACVLDNRSIHVIVDGDVLGRNNQPPHDICIVGWAPSYTTSLDAARTLVPEGWWLTLDRYSISDRSPDPFAWRVWMKRIVGDVDGDGPCATQEVFAHAVSAELALCAAALRAQAEMES